MASWNPILWLSGSALTQNKQEHSPNGRRMAVALIYGSIIFPAWFWVSQVTRNVPEPYLDEVFHIPQAQKYCDKQYQSWDPKITTPPGLYVFATVFVKLVGGSICNVYSLRLFNTVVLLMTMAYASACRDLITRLSKVKDFSKITKTWLNSHNYISFNTVHTAVNIALFPPLFFFSGLFYTDVLSTAVVLCMYMTFLRRPGAYSNSTNGSFRLYIIGIVALTMRQTNIFWVAIFMGGLEAVRTIKSISAQPVEPRKIPQNREEILAAFEKYKCGEIHDVPLSIADVPDFILCTISIATAILYNPLLILTRLWPYIALLFSFASFVFWNGGVVLGDKSNHVATLHLPQLLYLTAFTAFFSFPLLIPYAIQLILPFLPTKLHSLIPTFLQLPGSNLLKPTQSNSNIVRTALLLSNTIILLAITLAIIKSNTIIHPFTLADNRHYIFYIFRYTILRHWVMKYALAPLYLLSGWIAYRGLGGPEPVTCQISGSVQAAKTKAGKKGEGEAKGGRLEGGEYEGGVEQGPITTSFLLIYILSTSLSLITAPLVEPRYFILPWLIWRLHVPSLSLSTLRRTPYSRHDHRLWFETVWFLVINVVTGYIFLYRGFKWVQEPGRVQRFMW